MTFPENLDERSKYIEKQVLDGNFEAEWVEVVNNDMGAEVKLLVMKDALKVDGVRVNVSATTSQHLADIFGASLPTPLVADMMFAAATCKLLPCPMKISSTVDSMIKHSAAVESTIIQGELGLRSPVGKHWVLDKKLKEGFMRDGSNAACNYGWHFRGLSYKGIRGFNPVSDVCGPNVSLIQQNACEHNRLHVDYSQICQLVAQQCWIDGVEYKFSDVVKDPVLSKFVSHNGQLLVNRQPGVPVWTGNLVIFPISVMG